MAASQFVVTRMGDASAATGTAKTMLRLLANSNDPLTIRAWWIESDSVASSDKPIKVELLYETTTAAPTGTTSNPVPYGSAEVNGTANATGLVNCSVEGAHTSTVIENHQVPATGGLYIQYPLGCEITINASKGFRIRATAVTNTVNFTYGCIYNE